MLAALLCVAVWVGSGPLHARLLGVLVTPWDKVAHIAVFAGLALVCGALVGVRGARGLWACFALSLMVGVVDESLQLLDGARSADLDDLLADAVGASLGTLVHALRWHREQVRAFHRDDSGFTRR